MPRTNWKESQLGDLISIKHGFAFPGKNITDIKTENILATPGHFSAGGGFKNIHKKFFNGDIDEEYILEEGDLIITMTDLSKEGDTLGFSAIVPNLKNKKLLHNQRIGKVEIKSPDIQKDFLNYLLRDKHYRHWVLSTCTGSTVRHTSPSRIKEFKFFLPSIEEQLYIAEVLTSLDNKIELNQKMNETLEEIAKTLFKSWFIDFDPVRAKAEGRSTGLSKEISDLFPDSFEDSELGEIPKGWEIKKVKDLGKVICGKTPPTKDKENYGDGFNFVTIPDMHDQVFALESSKTITEKGSKTLKGKLLPTKTICVSCIATPGLTLIIDKPSYTNQQINSIIPNEDLLSYFLFLNFRTLGSKISIYGGGGSVFENMSKSKFEEILIKTPDEKILKYFEDYLCPIFEKIKINSKENKTLTRIRDTLLPKLISGELKIPDQGNLEEAGI